MVLCWLVIAPRVTKGEIFCLDPATGAIRWHDRLKGLGTGLVSIAVDGGASGFQSISLAEQRRREQAAAAAAGAAAT